MPKAIKKRVQKKTVDTEENVREKLTSFRETLRERQKTFIKYAAVVLVVIVVAAGFLLYTYNSRNMAERLGNEAYTIYYSASPQGAAKEEKYAKALDAFKKSYDKWKSPSSLFYIAACYDDLGKYDEALKTLKDFVQKYSNDQDFIPLAYQKMAMVYIKKGNEDEAKKTLDDLYNLKSDIFKDFALMEYARLLEKEGKPDEAKKKYEDLVKLFPDSPFRDEAKLKLAGKKEG